MEQLTVSARSNARISVHGDSGDVVRSVSQDAAGVARVSAGPAIGGAVASTSGASGSVCSARGAALLVAHQSTETPHISSFSLSATGLNLYILGVVWSPAAQIRFRCEDLTSGGYVYSDLSSAGTEDLHVDVIGSMIEGHQYRLAYLMDCIPDVPGWDDDAYSEFDQQIEWTQPNRLDPPVEYDYSEDE